MNQRFEAFLTVAELRSMQKAADRQCVSYQCISGHIRSLEEEYHTRLFERRPVFRLTESGRILMESLQRIRVIEQGIADALDDSGEEVFGKVRLGLPSSRYTEIVPMILAKFRNKYPNVELEITEGYSDDLQQQVERGTLDMAIAVQQVPVDHPALEQTVLLSEQYFFIISLPLLEQILGDETQVFINRAARNGITLADISRFPLVSYPEGSRLQNMIATYGNTHALKYRIVFSSNRPECFDAIARTNVAGCIISQQIQGITMRKNHSLKPQERLQSFRIDWGEHPVCTDMVLLRNRENVLNSYKRYLMQVIEEVFTSY